MLSKYLIIGDIHLRDYSNHKKYLYHQVQTIQDIILTHFDCIDGIIFLGDVFHFRKPSASEILAFRRIVNYTRLPITVLRGNHDSETKGDDGVTVLSAFSGYNNVKIYNHIGRDNEHGFTFIPHYENQDTIKKALGEVPPGDIVFGHFGYLGAYNAIGDFDSNIPLGEFNNFTILGHIHRTKFASDKVITLGTPYTTDYQEAGKGNVIGILTGKKGDWNLELEEVTHGLRHMAIPSEDLEANIEDINNPRFYTLMRVYLNQLSDIDSASIRRDLLEQYKVAWVDIKFTPLMDDKKDVSTFQPRGKILQIDDELIEKYVDENVTEIPKEDLMEGLEILKHADSET